jgi:two-component system, OmpR family, phosphate regulon response regulator PhoB
MHEDNLFVLAIDRDKSYASSLEFALNREGYSYRHFNDYQTAQSDLIDPKCQAVVIGRNLDGTSGLQLAKILRSESDTSRLTIILVAHAHDDFDVVESLESGVDDYMVKPLGPREFVYRFKAIQGRRTNPKENEASSNKNIGSLLLNSDVGTATVGGEPLRLTRTEFKILHCLVQSPERVFSRDQLMKMVSLEQGRTEHVRKIDVHIGRIRHELTRFKLAPIIQTVRGEGYFIRIFNRRYDSQD